MKKIISFASILVAINFLAKCFGLRNNEKLRRFNFHIRQINFKGLYSSYPLLDQDLKSYLDADSRSYSLKMVNTEGRPGLACNFNETITLSLPKTLKADDRILLSFCVLEPLHPEYDSTDGQGIAKISLGTSILNEKGETLHQGAFDVPLKFVNSVFLHNYGEGWISWFLPIAEFSSKLRADEKLKLVFHPQLLERAESAKPLAAPSNAVCLGFPQVVHPKKRPKKIINLSCESFTDPYVLKQMFPEHVHLMDPGIFKFMEKYSSAKFSYSQGDSTLPSANSQFSGLLALQHGIGNYNPSLSAPNTPVRNDAILSVAQLLKRAGFLTFATTMYTQFKAHYGCARGFDSYINVDPFTDPIWPNLENSVIATIESCKDADSFHYAHLDWGMHAPFIDARFHPFSGIHDLANLSDQSRRVNLYIQNMNRMFQDFQILDDYLERNKDKIDFLVTITGDHGHGLNPWWKNRKDFALYEQRVRVPLLTKDFSEKPHLIDRNVPINASIELFKKSIAFAGIELPSMISCLPQHRNEFQGISISETLLHPMDDDYCLVLSDGCFKYATTLKIDYDSRKVLNVVWEKLFKFDGLVPNESEDVKEANSEIWKLFRQKAKILVDESLEFNSKFPTMSWLDSNRPWSVKDPLSPSYSNQRKNKPKI